VKTDLWKEVVKAIEAAIPEYDRVNDKISLGRAMKAREQTVEQLKLEKGMVVLDAGIGPGTMSEVILSRNPGVTILGLDASMKLLQAARDRFRSRDAEIHFIRATFEAVPLRDCCINNIVSAYAFRDSRNMSIAIDEFSRVLVAGGCFGIVDLGKPDNAVKRVLITVYIRFVMPMIAYFSKSGRIPGNPWRMIVPTYRLLVTNGTLVQGLRQRFQYVRIWESLLGGLIVVLSQREPLSPSS
jgi:demethylmenaquinone methyltransferase/2-methoxy-6-polyprenyl-1,4-benzoquinol methylase